MLLVSSTMGSFDFGRARVLGEEGGGFIAPPKSVRWSAGFGPEFPVQVWTGNSGCNCQNRKFRLEENFRLEISGTLQYQKRFVLSRFRRGVDLTGNSGRNQNFRFDRNFRFHQNFRLEISGSLQKLLNADLTPLFSVFDAYE